MTELFIVIATVSLWYYISKGRWGQTKTETLEAGQSDNTTKYISSCLLSSSVCLSLQAEIQLHKSDTTIKSTKSVFWLHQATQKRTFAEHAQPMREILHLTSLSEQRRGEEKTQQEIGLKNSSSFNSFVLSQLSAYSNLFGYDWPSLSYTSWSEIKMPLLHKTVVG